MSYTKIYSLIILKSVFEEYGEYKLDVTTSLLCQRVFVNKMMKRFDA